MNIVCHLKRVRVRSLTAMCSRRINTNIECARETLFSFFFFFNFSFVFLFHFNCRTYRVPFKRNTCSAGAIMLSYFLFFLSFYKLKQIRSLSLSYSLWLSLVCICASSCEYFSFQTQIFVHLFIVIPVSFYFPTNSYSSSSSSSSFARGQYEF